MMMLMKGTTFMVMFFLLRVVMVDWGRPPLEPHHEKMSHFFVLNNKEHEMKTRNAEKYVVNFANTTKYRSSPIIHMQRVLNNYYKNG